MGTGRRRKNHKLPQVTQPAERYQLDTSVIMRLLVQEPPLQYSRAASFLEDRLAAGTTVHVSDLPLAEAYFALQSFYLLPKDKALEVLAAFVKTPGITFSSHALSVLAMPNLAAAKPGFLDRLIHGSAHIAGHTLVTFEKAAKNLPATLILQT
jgi:predicted nucleic-acid-binding protein